LAGLLEARAGLLEFFGGGGVEFEHVVVAGNDETGAAGFGEGGGFGAVEVAGDAAPGLVAVDGQEHEVALKRTEGVNESVVPEGVAAVVEGEGAATEDEADVEVSALVVGLEVVVGSGDALDGPLLFLMDLTVGERDADEWGSAETGPGIGDDGSGKKEGETGMGLGDGEEGLGVQVVRVKPSSPSLSSPPIPMGVSWGSQNPHHNHLTINTLK